MEGFNSLDTYLKSEILRKQADYLITIQYYHYTVKLFTWDRFFIEQYYDNDTGEVSRISLASSGDIRKYIKDVSLDELDLP